MAAEKKQKGVASSSQPLSSTIPSELVEEILLQLPAKSMSRFRCVEKSWNSVISNPQFPKKHLRLSSNRKKTNLLVNVTSTKNEFHLWNWNYPLHPIFDSTFTRLNGPSNIRQFVGSCNGILCFVTRIGTVVLWNPSIQKLKELPSASFEEEMNRSYCMTYPINPLKLDNNEQRQKISYSFGCNRLANTYKVVTLGVYRDHNFHDHLNSYLNFVSNGGLPEDKIEVRVHTLGGTNVWRRISDFPVSSSRVKSGTFVNGTGTLNWVCAYSYAFWAIISLDLEKECYKQISFPEKLSFPNADLSVLRDRLCVFGYSTRDYEQRCYLWMMKEYGNTESWTNLLSISVMAEPLIRQCPDTKALYVSEDNEQVVLYFPSSGRIVVYNSRDEISETKIEACSIADVYVESLILPNSSINV